MYTLLDYFKSMRKYVFVMIRQLGHPTFFVTFSSVEHVWDPLCNALKEIRKKCIGIHVERIF
jgi:hypothetical protein